MCCGEHTECYRISLGTHCHTGHATRCVSFSSAVPPISSQELLLYKLVHYLTCSEDLNLVPCSCTTNVLPTEPSPQTERGKRKPCLFYLPVCGSQRTTFEVCFLLPPYGSWGWNSGCMAHVKCLSPATSQDSRFLNMPTHFPSTGGCYHQPHRWHF